MVKSLKLGRYAITCDVCYNETATGFLTCNKFFVDLTHFVMHMTCAPIVFHFNYYTYSIHLLNSSSINECVPFLQNSIRHNLSIRKTMFGRQAATHGTPVSYWVLLPGSETELSKAVQVLNYIGPPFVEVGTEFSIYLPQLGTNQLQKFITSCVTRMASNSTVDVMNFVSRLPLLLQNAEKDNIKLLPVLKIDVVELNSQRKCNNLDITCVKRTEEVECSLPEVSIVPHHLLEHSYFAAPRDNELSDSPGSDKDDAFVLARKARTNSESDVSFRRSKRAKVGRRSSRQQMIGKRTAKRALSTELANAGRVSHSESTLNGSEIINGQDISIDNVVQIGNDSDTSEPEMLASSCGARLASYVDTTPKGSKEKYQEQNGDDLIKRRWDGRKRTVKDHSNFCGTNVISTKMLNDAMLTPTKILEAADALMLLSSPDFHGIPYNTLDVSTNSSSCDISMPSPLTPFKAPVANSTELSGNTPSFLTSIDSPTVDYFVAPSISSTPHRGSYLPLLTVSGSPSSVSWTSLLQSLTPAKEENCTVSEPATNQEDIETQVVDLEITNNIKL